MLRWQVLPRDASTEDVPGVHAILVTRKDLPAVLPKGIVRYSVAEREAQLKKRESGLAAGSWGIGGDLRPRGRAKFPLKCIARALLLSAPILGQAHSQTRSRGAQAVPSASLKVRDDSFVNVSEFVTLQVNRCVRRAVDTFKFMTHHSLKRVRYAAASVNLFGLMLSAGTWALNLWLRTHRFPGPYLAFIWTVGVFCWILGLLLFIAAWVAEGFAGGRWGAR
jgi:hypothetical protein